MSEENQTPHKKSGLAAFLAELKRRKVMRVAITYIVVAWLVIQVAVNTFPSLLIPGWALSFVVMCVILGFPVALVLAWAFELTPDGIKTTKVAQTERGDANISKKQQRKRNCFSLGLAAALPTVIFGVLALFFYVRSGGDSDAGVGGKSIAVLPLENMSPDPNNAYFADGIHDEILTNLANISDLTVIGRTSVRQYRDTVKTLQQIGKELGVRYLVEGSVFRDQNEAAINIQLIDTETRDHIWARVYERNLDNLFSIRSAVAKDVAEQLHAVLSPEEAVLVDEFPTKNKEAYDLYLLSLRGELGYQERQNALWRAVELDPNFYEAWANILTGLLYHYRVRTRRQEPEVLERARHAMEQLERTAPNRGLYLSRKSQFVYNVENDLHGSIALFIEGQQYDQNRPSGDLALRYFEAGRTSEALPLFEEDHRRDPHSMGTIQRLYLTYQLLEMWEEGRSLIRKAREHSEYYREFFAGFLPTLNYVESGDLTAFVRELELEDYGQDSNKGRAWAALISREYQKAYNLFQSEQPSALQLLSFAGRAWPSTFSLEPFDLGKALISFGLDNKEQWLAEAEIAKQDLENWIQDPYADPSHRYNLAICYALLGERSRMEEVIDEVREQIQSPNWAYRRGVLAEMHIAVAYIILGEHEKALSTLEVASKMEGSIFLNRELKLWFIFDRLRGNPRFDALLEG